jgi:hypothetical protein
MAPRHRKQLNGDRLGTRNKGRHVADHSTGSLSQGQLDCLVQIIDHVTELAGYLQDGYLADGARSGPHLTTHAWTAS